MFVGVHAMLATQLRTPELAISMQEGEMFRRSAENVLRHYSIEATQKTLDWIAFVGVAGGIYIPRYVAISMRQRQERIERAATGNVRPLRPDMNKRPGANNKDEPLVIVPEPEPEDTPSIQ